MRCCSYGFVRLVEGLHADVHFSRERVRYQNESLATLALQLHAVGPELGDELSALTARLMLRVCRNLGHVEIHNELAYALIQYEIENDY